MMKANQLVANKEWDLLQLYLCEFVSATTGVEDPPLLHPGLFLIPREKILLQLVDDKAFEEALSYWDKFIKPLKQCQSKFRPLDLECQIDELTTMINMRSMHAVGKRKSIGGAETYLSDYMVLYFPSAMCEEESYQQQEGTWQFAMKLPVPEARVSTDGKVQKPRHGFRCLACGWTSQGSHSISSLRYHIMHTEKSKGKPCPKVTQDMLDRLKAIDVSQDVPDLVSLVTRLKNKKPKLSFSSSVKDGLSLSKSDTGPSSTAPPQPFSAADPLLQKMISDPLLQKMDTLQCISSAVLSQIRASMPAPARMKCVEALKAHNRVLLELRLEYLDVTGSGPASASGPSNASSFGATYVPGGDADLNLPSTAGPNTTSADQPEH